jgi:hypothetical protein
MPVHPERLAAPGRQDRFVRFAMVPPGLGSYKLIPLDSATTHTEDRTKGPGEPKVFQDAPATPSEAKQLPLIVAVIFVSGHRTVAAFLPDALVRRQFA